MQMRSLGRCGIQVGQVGLGCEHLQGKDFNQIAAVIDAALAQGINCLDVFMSEPQVRSDIGKALAGRRQQVVLQGHIGSVWQEGQYARSRALTLCQSFFTDYLTRLNTDYIDIGMLHFVDTDADYEAVRDGGLLDYALRLKKEGVIRAVGMSSHNPLVAARAVQEGWLEVLMFSLNPAYDLLPEDTDIDGLFEPTSYQQALNGINPARARLYQLCEQQGVGITVMKGLAAGALLSAKRSPFGQALTPAQCIHYALTRPAVASVLVGCQTPEEVAAAASYEQTPIHERDYAPALTATAAYSIKGRCMYCNHCLPCPAHIDIAAVNKFLDLALLQEQPAATVRAHYDALDAHGEDCIACRACEARCPFGVDVTARMGKAQAVFGR